MIMEKMKIEGGGKITAMEIEDIRRSVRWNPHSGRYKKAIKQTYSWYTVRQKSKLIAFARVVSDDSVYAFIVDVNVRPEFQGKGIGKRLIIYIIKDLKQKGICGVELIFEPVR